MPFASVQSSTSNKRDDFRHAMYQYVLDNPRIKVGVIANWPLLQLHREMPGSGGWCAGRAQRND